SPCSSSDDGAFRLNEEAFSEPAWVIVEASRVQAESLGHKQIGLTALLLSMIEQVNGNGEAETFQSLLEKLRRVFGAEESAEEPLELSKDFMSEEVQRVLSAAAEAAGKDNSLIEPQHLWTAVLAEAPHLLKQVFEKLPFQVEFEQEEQEAANQAEDTGSIDDWTEQLSPVMGQALGAEDLTFLALSDGLTLALERSFLEGDVYEKMARSLFRGEAKHVVVTGDKGVGKTVVLRELARRAKEGRSNAPLRWPCFCIV
ncbi:MAG: hypothetical protein KDA84_05160, partial [Planctomycetaceae bacterium]|nr:hypothetical protein [Planctomycetaceae bacterium]